MAKKKKGENLNNDWEKDQLDAGKESSDSDLDNELATSGLLMSDEDEDLMDEEETEE